MNGEKITVVRSRAARRGVAAALIKSNIKSPILRASKLAEKLNTSGRIHSLLLQRKTEGEDLFLLIKNEIECLTSGETK